MKFETLAIHAGQEPDPNNGAVMTPVYLTSTYMQDGVGKPRQGYEYSRTMNPTRKALQHCLRRRGSYGLRLPPIRSFALQIFAPSLKLFMHIQISRCLWLTTRLLHLI